MPLHGYGVLACEVVGRRAETRGDSPHYEIHARAGAADFRVAVNVKSRESPSELLYVVDDDFRHPVVAGLGDLAATFTPLARGPGGLALDYVRANLFDRVAMRPLPHTAAGPANDLNEMLDHYVARAQSERGARLYAFGQRWGPEAGRRDGVFGFSPGNGVHDVHMNQGNAPEFTRDDGVWQDGGLVIGLPGEGRHVGVFLAFQSQAWHTDDVTGHALPVPDRGPAHEPGGGEPDLRVRVVAALVDARGGAPERETVTLLNASPEPVDLAGWAIADRLKRRHVLSGPVLAPGAATVVTLPAHVRLANAGGIVTLLDADGLKVDGVSYTAADVREGWTVVF